MNANRIQTEKISDEIIAIILGVLIILNIQKLRNKLPENAIMPSKINDTFFILEILTKMSLFILEILLFLC